MSKQLKKFISDAITKRIGDMKDGCVLVDYRGLNSEQTYDLRLELRRGGVRMMVVHNRLARRVFAESKAPEAFQSLFRGPTALLLGKDGALGASKSIVQWRKKNKELAPIKGGLFQGKALSPEDVGRLAQIPDVATLRSQALGYFLGPLTHLATVTASLLSQFAGCVKAHRETLEAGGGGAAGAAGETSPAAAPEAPKPDGGSA
jgi:large subunit ribosomal protein L10